MTLVDWLRSRGPAALARLLTLRPDLADPPPADLGALTGRLLDPSSLERAVGDLGAMGLQVLEAVHLLDDGATITQLVSIGGETATTAQVEAAVAELRDRALVLADGPLVVPVGRVWLPLPAGLGPPMDQVLTRLRSWNIDAVALAWGVARKRSGALTADAVADAAADPDRVFRLLDALVPADRERVVTAARGTPQLRMPGVDPWQGGQATSPADQRLLRSGLVVPFTWHAAIVPEEVCLAVRRHPVIYTPEPPEVRLRAVPHVDVRGADAAAELVEAAERLAEELETPLLLLQSGGAAVKDIRRLAGLAGTQAAVRLLLNAFDEAGGLTITWSKRHHETRLTQAYERWLEQDAPGRWATLVSCWYDGPAPPAPRPGSALKAVAPLALTGSAKVDLRQLRRHLLEVLATVDGAPDPDDLVRLLDHVRAPRRVMADQMPAQELRAELALDLLGELELLGLTAGGALTSLGRGLLGGDPEGAARAALEEGLDEVVVQADLSVVCAGRPSRALRRDLDLLADPESRGAASTWRLSEISLRRAYDAGWEAVRIDSTLREHAPGGLPQAVSYLIADAARRYGRLRVGLAGSYLRSDDPVLIAEALADRALRGVGLVALAPTVAVTSASPAELLDALRRTGRSPAAETHTGAVVLVTRAKAKRAPAPRRLPLPARPSPTADPVALAHALLASRSARGS